MRSILTFVTVALSLTAQAAELRCQNQMNTILEVYKAKISDCRDFNNQAACDNICQNLQAGQVVPGGCSAAELDLARRDAERVTLDRVRMDMLAEGAVRVSAVGSNEQECLQNARIRARAFEREAIEQCVSKTSYFRTCTLVPERLVEAPSRVVPFVGTGHIDKWERELGGNPEQQCKMLAEQSAANNAVAACRASTGVNCVISTPASPATSRREERRRYGIAGPKDGYQICDSRAEAMPDASAQFRCTIEIVSRVRF